MWRGDLLGNLLTRGMVSSVAGTAIPCGAAMLAAMARVAGTSVGGGVGPRRRNDAQKRDSLVSGGRAHGDGRLNHTTECGREIDGSSSPSTRSNIDASSFAGLFTRVLIGYIFMAAAGNGTGSQRGSGSSVESQGHTTLAE
jgi:hypothetical protein